METKPCKLISCDCFVALPPVTWKDCVIFGKNSDRPVGEVQEVVYFPAKNYSENEKLQCTYIEIPQVLHTHAVILSKPSWMWGAEMGANEHGVCVGNEAVWTKLNGPEDHEEKLLGMDLVRLALERSKTAKEAVDVITALLAEYGQGGPCSDIVLSFTYHNSYLIADRTEAWVLETAEKQWAAEKITTGVRNISNCLTITTNVDAMSPDLKQIAIKNDWWRPSKGDFDFSKIYGDENCQDCFRYSKGKILLLKLSSSGCFGLVEMISVLRDKRSGINMNSSTTGSQISILPPMNSNKPCCHWFTATPDPSRSVFKPFMFCPDVVPSGHTQSPVYSEDDDPAKVVPRFQSVVDRRHNLYKLHEAVIGNLDEHADSKLVDLLQNLEQKCIKDIEKFVEDFNESKYSEIRELFKDVVEAEMKFYK